MDLVTPELVRWTLTAFAVGFLAGALAVILVVTLATWRQLR